MGAFLRIAIVIVVGAATFAQNAIAVSPTDTKYPRQNVTVDFLFEACSVVGETARGKIPFFDCESYVYGVLDDYLSIRDKLPFTERACFPLKIEPWRVLKTANYLVTDNDAGPKLAAPELIKVLKKLYPCKPEKRTGEISTLPGVTGQNSSSATKEINDGIDHLISLYSDGIAVSYPEFRQIWMPKVENNKSSFAFALFSIEGFHGSNMHGEYLAVFLPVAPENFPGHIQHNFQLISVKRIGGRMWRTFDWDASVAEGDEIKLVGKQWVDGNPGCCPSKEISVTFQVGEYDISEKSLARTNN